MAGKVLIGDKDTILLLPAVEILGVPHVFGPSSVIAFDALTNAVYNKYIPIVTNATSGWGAGGNVTCAIQDDYTLGSTDPEIDDTKTVCSKGSSGAIKRYNFEAEFNVFRDITPTSTSSVFAMASDLVRAADIPYIIAHRIGYSSDTASAVGHEWNLYYVHTDNPVDTSGDDEWQMRTQTFIPKGIISYNQEVAS
jgi:hypothetical protein